ncbi:hypothetical protein JYU34_013808 [Plutella xylostella]|uniref:Uncharacterized protein n=1 Tax=Plutella xylostella TaxID=51655 RepID=A0ABQ7QAP7_PLUXY|nr:hypothetical protein JYU34_013808 [Plutella xylostella]
MRVPRFQRVFWCLHLRRGCILLVYLNLLVCAMAVLAFGFLDFMKTFLRLFLQDWYTGLHRAFRSKKRLDLLKVTLYFNVLISAFMFLFRMFDVGHYSWRAELFAAVVYAAYKCYYILCIRSVVKKWLESDKKSVDTALEIGREELELALPTEEVSDETT